jgi:glycosyltransferase involved in cell wall biosynthesis
VISIIIPVYNRDDKIARAIKSVLSQSYSDWELILVDDCSTDRSLQVINSFKDDRIVVLSTLKNVGPAAARNMGVSRSTGGFITFLDSDDFFEDNYLELSLRLLSGTDETVGFSWTGYRYITSNGDKAQFWQPSDCSNAYLSFLNALHTGTNSGLMIKRAVFDTCGYFDDALLAAEDTDFLLRIVQSYNFKTISLPLVNIYKGHSDRLSSDFNKIALAYSIIFPKHERVISINSSLRLKWYYKMMWLNYHKGDFQSSRFFFRKLLKDKFTHFKAWQIFFLFEVLGSRYGAKVHVFLSSKIE